MKIIFSFLALAFLLTSCNDGEIITAELDFDETFKTCGELVCYKIKTNPSESLSLILDTTLEALIATTPDTDNPLLVNLNDSDSNRIFTISATNSFNYRTYNSTVSNTAFCSAIPPSDLNITNDYVSNEGNAIFTIILTEDDNDGIPAEFEDINNDGNLDNDDTDGDGLPNYLDDDDDGDNVKTTTEMPNFSTEFELTQALDTDEDGVPNYLDTDDDDDGQLTRNEDRNQNNNPADDVENSNVGADYLNEDVHDATIPEATAYRAHAIEQSFQTALIITNITLPILTQDIVDFGTLTTTNSREVTPNFN